MDKAYDPKFETDIYSTWEKAGIFTPKVPQDPVTARLEHEPFTIILPPPNANDPLHAGHALFTVEDIMVRFHRLLGDPTLWLPGTDHAGIETQFVYEKKLQKQGKSRFDYDRDTLFKMISEYVAENSTTAVNQMKRLGFSLDWTRLKFAMDEDHNQRIFAIFRKMVADGLVYRDEKIVNYCTFCGTSFSNLEVVHKTVASHLWYFKYPLADNPAEFVMVATTRPETMLGDTAVAVNPADPRFAHLQGKKLLLPIANREIPIIFEDTIDPKFGTGAVKVTPSHSPEDYDMGKKFGLEFIRIFDYDGKANKNVPEKYRGLYPNQVRDLVIEDLKNLNLMDKIEDYSHEVGHCYKCGRPIEPITAPQWFVKIAPLANAAVKAVKADQVKFFPPRFKKQFLQWMTDIRDWNISRQVVWGQRIPVWYNLSESSQIKLTFLDENGREVSGTWSELQSQYSDKFSVVSAGLQSLLAPVGSKFYLSLEEAQKNSAFALQETDTFDTWFSSGQWPYSTLGWDPDGHHSPDFLYFYPTTVLDTMWDILFFWVARMIMFGIYATGEVPFKMAHMHSRVVDAKGQKMSKSKGNVINPIDIADKYGADALRMALVIGVAPGSDIPLSDDKVRAQRNFVNKIWNASRFVTMLIDRIRQNNPDVVVNLELPTALKPEDEIILSRLNEIISSTTNNLQKYRFGQASEDLYQFFWHDFCDVYIEAVKDRGADVIPVLLTVLTTSLTLLHPFIPFVTESVFQTLKASYGLPGQFLAVSNWPKTLKNGKSQ